MTSSLALTFHGLESQVQKGYLPVGPAGGHYVVSEELLKEALAMASGQSTCTAVDFFHKKSGDWTVITFDDGLASDYEIAFPLLAQQGLAATFFVTVGNVGTPGYVSRSQLREMVEAGMEIGSHGLTHSYLVNMDPRQVQKEIAESHERLAQIISKPVYSFAPVGGHFSRPMQEMALAAGYRCFASMIPGLTHLHKKEEFILRRNHLQAQHDIHYLRRLLGRDKGLLVRNFLRYQVLFIAKRILGMQHYDQVKSLFVQGGSA